MIVCRTCNLEKSEQEFAVQRRGGFRFVASREYRRKDCKPCLAAKAREWRKTHPGYSGSGRDTQYPKEHRIWVSAIRTRVLEAKRRSSASLDVGALYRQLVAQDFKCAISGLPLSVQQGHPHVISIDQKRAGGGYTPENVQLVSWAVNRAKGDLTDDEFLSMCKAIVEGATTIPNGSTPKRVEARSSKEMI